MKKIILAMISIVIVTLIIVFVYNNMFNKKQNFINDVSYNEIEKMQISKKTFVVYVYQQGCAPCQKVKPIVNEFAKENEDKVVAVDANKDENIDYLDKAKIKETPSFIFYKNGTIKHIKSGVLTEDKIKKYLN